MCFRDIPIGKKVKVLSFFRIRKHNEIFSRQMVRLLNHLNCYMSIGGDGIILFTNASVPEGGTLKYQWYVTDIENMAMIRAIDYAEGDSYQVPEELGVKWYCYAAWNVIGGLEGEPTYSRLIRVEFYKNSSAHTHSFGEWMVTTKPTCTEAGIKTRECDCGVTERAEVPAAGHN